MSWATENDDVREEVAKLLKDKMDFMLREVDGVVLEDLDTYQCEDDRDLFYVLARGCRIYRVACFFQPSDGQWHIIGSFIPEGLRLLDGIVNAN